MARQKYIKVEIAGQWLAKLASIDGVLTQNEIEVLKEFAKKYNVEADDLISEASNKAKDIPLEEVVELTSSQIKGLKFEKFIVDRFNGNPWIELVSWRSDKKIAGMMALDSKLPDLRFRHYLTPRLSVEYLIECKYRTNLPKNGLDLCNNFDNYIKEAEKDNITLFFAVGIGGLPDKPKLVSLIPADSIRINKIIDKLTFEEFIFDPKKKYLPEIIEKYLLLPEYSI